jgi:putative ABC transport system substrate-binding protein
MRRRAFLCGSVAVLPAPLASEAQSARKSVPIVFETLGEPITAGLVVSLARPGANLTGISGLGPELSGKRLELLRELVPGLRRVAVLVNPRNVMAAPMVGRPHPPRPPVRRLRYVPLALVRTG